MIIFTMKFGPLSGRQRLVVWATLCLAVLAILYPMPAHYTWEGDSWERSSYHSRTDSRGFLWDYEFFGSTRPDLWRTATETLFVLVMGLGLCFCIRTEVATGPGGARSSADDVLGSVVDRTVVLWMIDDAVEMLKKSSFWCAAKLEEKLILTANEGGEKAYETSEQVAIELLQWFKFRFFDAWQATGGKGSAFDGIDLTGADSAKQMERVNCWLTMTAIESALGETARRFGNGAPLPIRVLQDPK